MTRAILEFPLNFMISSSQIKSPIALKKFPTSKLSKTNVDISKSNLNLKCLTPAILVCSAVEL